jgi:hypothetical protein
MTIIITDEDVKRLLPMRDCIEAMRVAFRDLATGAAVNRPRVRYLAKHPDPERKYLANVHVGAVPSCGIACVRAGSQSQEAPPARRECPPGQPPFCPLCPPGQRRSCPPGHVP